MDASTRSETTADPIHDADRAWYRVGRDAGYIAGACFLVVTVLFLLDAVNLLGAGPQFHRSGAGFLQDEASFWVATFAHQHRILWDILARDTLGPIAFVALIVVALAIRRLVRDDRPEAQLMVLFLLIGGIISAIASLIYLGNVEFWRVTGWSAQSAPVSMVAVGRDTVAVNTLTTWPEVTGYMFTAVGLICMGRLCRISGKLPAGLGPLSYVEAALLIGIAVTEVLHRDTAFNILSLVTGAMVAPALGFLLGRHFGRLARPSSDGRTHEVVG